jgi:hypothetical protein
MKNSTVVDIYYQTGTGEVNNWIDVVIEDVDEFAIQFTYQGRLRVEPISNIVRIFGQ